jgi:uncharacterized protein with HEPN domain
VSRDWRWSLHDMIEAGENAVGHAHGATLEKFRSDRKTQAAVERELSILGEAAKAIPQEVRLRHPDVEWKLMAGLRDVLMHAYFEIDVDVVWSIVADELPPVLVHLRHVASAESEPPASSGA